MLLSGNNSPALKISNRDDYLLPATSCIVSLKAPSPASASAAAAARSDARVTMELEGFDEFASSRDIAAELANVEALPRASITLADCLACSGCITTAESMLIEQHSSSRLIELAQSGTCSIVVSLAQQPMASLAAHFGASVEDVAMRLSGFFKTHLGALAVMDCSVGRDISLLEVYSEFVEAQTAAAAEGRMATVFSGSCPGFVCLAEKSAAHILPCISRVKSQQAVMGTLVQQADFRSRLGLPPAARVLHVCLMMCPDKKLEATRADFASMEGSQDTEIVVTATEVVSLIGQCGLASLSDAEPMPLDWPWGTTELAGPRCTRPVGSGISADGQLEYLFRRAAFEMFGVAMDAELPYRRVRNNDMHEVVLEQGGAVVLRMGRAYGLQNLQTMIRQCLRGECHYHFIEAMACPRGCLNGGGQLRKEDLRAAKAALAATETAMLDLPAVAAHDSAAACAVYEALGMAIGSPGARTHFHTELHAVTGGLAAESGLAVRW